MKIIRNGKLEADRLVIAVFVLVSIVLFLLLARAERQKNEASQGFSSAVLHLLDSENSDFSLEEIDYVLSVMSEYKMNDEHSRNVLHWINIEHPDYVNRGAKKSVVFLKKNTQGK